jgi:hypothetical protein
MAEMEEILEAEEDVSDDEGEADSENSAPTDQEDHLDSVLAGREVETQQGSLSSIEEEASGTNTSASTSPAGENHPISFGQTEYFTPQSPRLHQGTDLLSLTDSPFLPLAHRQHLSCPPLPISQALLAAQGDHAKAMEEELEQAKVVINELVSEIEKLKAGDQTAEAQEESQYQAKLRDLNELLEERESGRLDRISQGIPLKDRYR